MSRTCAIALLLTCAVVQSPAAIGRCDLDALATVTSSSVTIRAAERIAGPEKPGRQSQGHCRVEASVSAAPGSLINFEVWVPDRWNRKLVVTGNGGYGNTPSTRDMSQAVAAGYAAIGGDTGHQTPTPDDLLWGAGHPERITDWGSRSIHAITAPGRRIVEIAGGESVRRAYFNGCSTGGHQAYAEIQRYPQDFDGVVAGAPGNNRVRLNAGFLWQFLANRRRADNSTIIPPSKLPMITQAIVAACDANDGVTDGVVDDPRTCRFDPAALQCMSGDEPGCLTNEQVGALNKMYAGARNPRTGEQIYPGWPKSSEALTVAASGQPQSGWHQYWGTAAPTRVNFWRHWVFADPGWDWWSFDFDRDLGAADATVGRLIDQVNPDLSAFKARGGKAIVYQGWQDPVVNAIDTIAFYERVRARQGSARETEGFFRLFMVPGMGHCSGGPGATDFDAVAALDRWVEEAVPPDRVIASRIVDGATVRTRPLCPYPQKAVYIGSGSTDDAANFVCR
jgi:feruloyl esterase